MILLISDLGQIVCLSKESVIRAQSSETVVCVSAVSLLHESV